VPLDIILANTSDEGIAALKEAVLVATIPKADSTFARTDVADVILTQGGSTFRQRQRRQKHPPDIKAQIVYKSATVDTQEIVAALNIVIGDGLLMITMDVDGESFTTTVVEDAVAITERKSSCAAIGCFNPWKSTHTCRCDINCVTVNDCCGDFKDICSHESTISVAVTTEHVPTETTDEAPVTTTAKVLTPTPAPPVVEVAETDPPTEKATIVQPTPRSTAQRATTIPTALVDSSEESDRKKAANRWALGVVLFVVFAIGAIFLTIRSDDDGTPESVSNKGAFIHFANEAPAPSMNRGVGAKLPTDPQLDWAPVDGFALGSYVRGASGIVETGSLSPSRHDWRPATLRQGSLLIEGLDNGSSSTDLLANVRSPGPLYAGAFAGGSGSATNLGQSVSSRGNVGTGVNALLGGESTFSLGRKITARRKEDEVADDQDDPLPTPPGSPSRPTVYRV